MSSHWDVSGLSVGWLTGMSELGSDLERMECTTDLHASPSDGLDGVAVLGKGYTEG